MVLGALWQCPLGTTDRKPWKRKNYCALPEIFSFLLMKTTKMTQWILCSLSVEKHHPHCSSPHGWLWLGASPQALAELASGRVDWAGVCSAPTVLTVHPKRCVVQAETSSKPGYFCFQFRVPCHLARGGVFGLVCIYVYAG